MAFNLFPQTDFRQMDLNYVLEVSKQAAANLEEYAADKEQVVATQAAAEEALAAAQQDIQTATQAAASAGQEAQTATQAAGTATQAAASAEKDAQTASAAAATATAVQESIPADYTTMSNDVDNLKSDLNAFGQNIDSMRKAFPTSTNMFNIDDPDVMIGEYLTNAGEQLTSQTGVLCESGFIAVEPSTRYTIGADVADHPRFTTEYDSSKNVISNGGTSDANLTTSANTAYIRFCYRNTDTNWRMNKGGTLLPYEPYYYDYIKTDNTLTEEFLPANAKTVGDIFRGADFESVTYAADESIPLTFTDGYIDTAGDYHESTQGTLHYSQKIYVNEGDIIYAETEGAIRFLCAYDAGNVAVSASGGTYLTRYTVPSGIAFIVITLYKSYTGSVRRIYSSESIVLARGTFGYFRTEGSLSDGDALTLPVTNVNKNIRQAFTADITLFSGLLIGRKTENQGYWVTIDGTNITPYRDNVAQTPIPHGLTIANNIQVRIITHDNLSNPDDLYNADIVLTSNGISFTAENVGWVRTYNTPIVQSVGSTLTNCVMSWEAGDVNKAIYMFGDSYFSWYAARWTYYCALDGFANNALFNAYAGEDSANAIVALNNVVPMGKPKYIVWCLGMNDGSDTDSAPSSAWAIGRDAVINICSRYGITPIFGTIPTVPTINHEQKNAWIRSSGYRYIDFAKAVGADASGNWYSGMIESDHVHPSQQGAKALYGRVLTDFPEIMVSN